MNLLYVSNENYVKHLATSLVSVLSNHTKASEIVIYVFSTGITEESRAILEDLANMYDRELIFRNLEDIRDQFDYSVDTGKFDISIMGRIFMDRLLPKNVERVLYLDCDTVVTGDLSKLYHFDLRGKSIGAVMEPTIDDMTKIRAGLDIDAPYFNSGVLLVDLKSWREKHFTERILAYHESINEYAMFGDQDAINGALRWEIRILPPKYNFFSNYKYWSYEELVKSDAVYSLIPKKSYRIAKKKPVIIHFAGDERPWRRGNFNPFRREYEKYKALTFWYKDGPERGMEVWMFLYHCMNLLTVVCPNARRRISQWYMQRQRADKSGSEEP